MSLVRYASSVDPLARVRARATRRILAHRSGLVRVVGLVDPTHPSVSAMRAREFPTRRSTASTPREGERKRNA
jgi:hypothetical protein